MYLLRRVLLLIVAACFSCSSGSSVSPDTASDRTSPTDIPAADQADGAGPADLAPDADGCLAETGDQGPDDLPAPAPRTYTYRGVGGISMGACGLVFHAHHPGYFDTVAAYGGYINFHYLQDFFSRMMFGGFCDRETLLAHLDELNDPEAPDLQCGPVAPKNPWEFAVDFNHWHFDTSGGTWDRSFYWDAMEGIFTAFGNLVSYNPDHPFLPIGVPLSWVAPGNDAEKCATPAHVGKPHNYNAEYNPDGEFDLITFCDGEEPIPGDEDNPDYWTLKGAYDPTYEHTLPVRLVLAVDYNGNGRRDYHEPIVINSHERYQDTGPDGCADGDEDGNGGCAGGGAGADPNFDDFHLLDSPLGQEGDAFWQQGEPYEDNGLDGVPGTGDYGEEDGAYSMNPRLEALLDSSIMHWLDYAPKDQIDAADILFDGGIRDALHSLVGTYSLAMHLKARQPSTTVFDGYTEFPTSLLPVGQSVILLVAFHEVDWSVAGLGKNFIVRYGDPDATPDEIAAGNGKHVGTDIDMLNRVATMLLTPLMRWPDLDWTECQEHTGQTANHTFYSPALQNRYGYSISLPPCYDAPGYEDVGFPLYIYLPGHGIAASDAIAAGVAFNILMQGGVLPKFIFAAAEGQCCYLDNAAGARYCACLPNKEDDDYWDCADPACTGPEQECDILKIKRSGLEQECNGGHFFANQVSNRFGDVSAAQYMKYEDMLLDLTAHLEANYRLKEPKTVGQ